MIKKLTISSITIFLSICIFSLNLRADEICTVTRIVDGDTFYCKFGNKEKKVRLIGVDAPETYITSKLYDDVHQTGNTAQDIRNMGNITKKYLISLIDLQEEVRLESDVQEIDKYGRILAYVYLPDGSMLNQLLLVEGYAKVMTIPPNVKYKNLFIQSQKEARDNNKGLWNFNGG